MTAVPRNRLWQHLLPLAIYLAAYYAFSHPAFHRFATHFMCDDGDGMQNIWNNWWVRHAVATGHNPYYTDYLFHPEGVPLIGATLNPFNGLMTVPICWFFDATVGFNLTVVFAFVVGGYTAFLLARELTGAYWPSVFCGAVFTFSPYHFAHAIGHMQLVSLQWFPFFFWAWIRLLRAPGHGRALIAALALFLNVLCDYYYTLYGIMGGGLLFVYQAFRQREPLFFLERRTLIPLLTFVAASLLTTGWVLGALLYIQLTDPFDGSHAGGGFQSDLLGWLIPGGMWWAADWTEWFWKGRPAWEAHAEFGTHLGLSTLLLCGYAVWQSRRLGTLRDTGIWVFVGVLFYALSLGPTLIVAGRVYDIFMPYDLFSLVFPIIELAGCPVRMAVLTNLAAAVLCAFALHYLARSGWWRPIHVPLLIALFALDVWPKPQVTIRYEVPPAIQELGDLPPGAVMGFDVGPYPLWLQTHFQKPMGPGYIARTPRSRSAYAAEAGRLRAAGEYEALLRLGDAKYLVREKHSMAPVQGNGLRLIADDPRFEVYGWAHEAPVAAADAAPRDCGLPAEIRLHPSPAAGGHAELRIHSLGDGGRRYFCAFSRSRAAAPIRYEGGAEFGLETDAVFHASMQKDGGLIQGNWGRFAPDGSATITVDLRQLTDTGSIELWYSVIVWQADRPSGICRISEPRKIELRRQS